MLRPRREPGLLLALAIAGMAAIGALCVVALAGPARVAGLVGTTAGARVSPRATAAPGSAGVPASPGLPVTGHGLKPPSLPDQPLATPPSGILDTNSGPFPAGEFTVRNAWRGQVGSSVVWAYAGAAAAGKASPGGTAAHGRPALRLYLQAAGGDEPHTSLVGTYVAPGADGPLAIASAEGAILTLRTDRGGVYHFDLRRRRFA